MGHIENLVENRIETINATIEEELGQDNDQCDQCGKNFGSKTNLEEHKKREHKITSEEGSKIEEKSSETRMIKNRVENDVKAEELETIITTEETIEDIPDITSEEMVEDIQDITTEEEEDIQIEETLVTDTEVCRPYAPLSVQDKEEITTEEIVEIIPNDNLLETYEMEIPGKRLEELKEIMGDWIEYNFTEHKSEEEYLIAKEKNDKNTRRKASVFGRVGHNMDDVAWDQDNLDLM